MRAVRALRAVAGPVLLLVLTTAVAVGGTSVAVTALAGDGRVTVTLPLVLLAWLVLPLPAAELARSRRAETTLVRVRGASGVRLLADVAALPAGAVVAGTASGLAGALGVLALLRERWGDDPGLDATALGWAGAVAAGGLLVVTAVAVGVAREPLATALHRPTWRRSPGLGDLLVTIALGVAAATVLLLWALDDPGDLVLAGPAVLGAAAGHALVLALRAGVPLATDGERTTPVLLALRRLAAPDGAGRLRAVVASGLVVAASLSATTAAGAWADSSARLQHGAPLRVDLPGTDALSALVLTRELDPEGRWLMAGAVATERQEVRLRVAWLDLERLERVAGTFLDRTPADLGPAISPLRDAAAVELVDGGVLAAERRAGDGDVTLTLTYVGDTGAVESGVVALGDGATSAQVPVTGCATGCVVTGLTTTRSVDLTSLILGDTDLLARDWTIGTGDPGAPGAPGEPRGSGALSLPDAATAVLASASAPLPVLSAGDPDWEETGPAVPGIGGGSRTVVVEGTRAALPLVEGAGVVADLPVALAGARGSVSSVAVLVLARSDTPDDLFAALRSAGGEPRSLAATETALGAPDLAERRARTAIAVAAALLGLLALLAGAQRRTREERRVLAALRLVGVPASEVRRAGLLEGAGLGVAVTSVLALVGWVSGVTVVDAGLVPDDATRMPFDDAVEPVVLGLTALAVAGVMVTTTIGVRLRARRHSAPRSLLEDAS